MGVGQGVVQGEGSFRSIKIKNKRNAFLPFISKKDCFGHIGAKESHENVDFKEFTC